ncbi:MAG: hypothetical protein JXR96_21190 [Deltaproteobacteria bacterium]|nr:hypothetical protein [Deltaproteobacteria bacterium]
MRPPCRLAAGLVPIALLWPACSRRARPSSPEEVLGALRGACTERDTGAILGLVDREYSDDLGGVGRLEDDLRQLFTVYGSLSLRVADLRSEGERLTGQLAVEGRAFRFEGPLAIQLVSRPMGHLIRSGLLCDLRGVVKTLRERRIALEQGDAERLGRAISMSYRGRGGGFAELMDRVRVDLAAVQMTALIIRDVDIRVAQDRATARQSYLLIHRAGGDGGTRSVEKRARERLELAKEGARWRIVAGLG